MTLWCSQPCIFVKPLLMVVKSESIKCCDYVWDWQFECLNIIKEITILWNVDNINMLWTNIITNTINFTVLLYIKYFCYKVARSFYMGYVQIVILYYVVGNKYYNVIVVKIKYTCTTNSHTLEAIYIHLEYLFQSC